MLFIKTFQRGLRLYRAYRGRCPYCGSGLEFTKRSKGVTKFYKMCPDGHFGVENHGDGRVTYHDKQGDPIALFHDRKLKLIKGERQVSESAITTKIIPPFDDKEDTHGLDKEEEDLT